MKAGTLRHWVLIENRVVTPDAHGGEVVTWSPLATLRGDGLVAANMKFQTGMEVVRGDAILGPRKASAQIQWRADIGSTARLTFDGIVYDIKSMQPDNETGRDYLFCACEGAVNNG